MPKKPNACEFVCRKPLLSLTIGIVLFAIGILISDVPTMMASPSWPTTSGTITSNRIVGQKFKQYNDTYYTNFDVYIRFQYSVHGISYSSPSVNAIDTPFYPAEIASRYPVGKAVIVYYNPKNPADAVLEPGFVNVLQAFDIFSYFFFGTGIYFIFQCILRLKENYGREHRKI